MIRQIKNIGAKVIYTKHFRLPRRGGGGVLFFSLALPAFLISAILFLNKIRGRGRPPGLLPQIRRCGHRKNESAFQVVWWNSWRYTFLVLWLLPLATRLLKYVGILKCQSGYGLVFNRIVDQLFWMRTILRPHRSYLCFTLFLQD